MVKELKNGPIPQSTSRHSHAGGLAGPCNLYNQQTPTRVEAGDLEATTGETPGERQRSYLGRKKTEGQLKEFLTLEQ